MLNVVQARHTDRKTQLDALYLATLSRQPTADESTRLEIYLDAATEADRNQSLSDVHWMLLSSAKFRWNH